jgi:hypothetical protein
MSADGMALPGDLEAHIDGLSPAGVLEGWAWNRAAPDRSVTLDVLIDDAIVGQTVADLFREDLRLAGKGSGYCAFSVSLPLTIISMRREIPVSLRDCATGMPAGPHVVLQNPVAADAGMHDAPLARVPAPDRAALPAAEAAAVPQAGNGATPDMLRLVAAFLNGVADAHSSLSPTGIKARLDAAARQFPLVLLETARAPDVTIFVVPDGHLEHLHACLDGIHRAGADRRSVIVVVDDGVSDQNDAVLAPAIARNIQVWRLRPGETFADALLGITTPYVAIVPAHLVIGPFWLDHLLAALAAEPRSALAASAVSFRGQPARTGRLAATATGDLAAMRSAAVDDGEGNIADAVDTLGLVLGTETLRDIGGLDPSFSSLAAQILDYCLRLRGLGYSIKYRGTPMASAVTDPLSLLDQTTGPDMERIHARAASLARTAPAQTPPTSAPAGW